MWCEAQPRRSRRRSSRLHRPPPVAMLNRVRGRLARCTPSWSRTPTVRCSTGRCLSISPARRRLRVSVCGSYASPVRFSDKPSRSKTRTLYAIKPYDSSSEVLECGCELRCSVIVRAMFGRCLGLHAAPTASCKMRFSGRKKWHEKHSEKQCLQLGSARCGA